MTSVGRFDYSTRQAKLLERMDSEGLEAIALNPGPSLKYLTGLSFHLMERPVVAIFSQQSQPIMILPQLEMAKIAGLSYPTTPFPYGEEPSSWGPVFRQAAEAAGFHGGKRVGIEPRVFRVLELRLIESAAPQSEYVSAEESLASLRSIKEPGELEAMRNAVKIAEKALLETLPMVKAGVTEKHIASELTLQLLRHGSEPEIPFSPIVSSGPNSANPHASPTDRRLEAGDLLVIDWGATWNGYISDITRTFAVQYADAEMTKVAQIVAEANAAGRLAAGPEVTAAEVDAAARTVIQNSGYGDFFTHRTGHGIGMEGHEAPYIRSGNDQPLQPGMTFTVEPGIYLPGRNGVRIEDNVVITATGIKCLTSLARELVILS
jgi:Xaa-Pro dipeptidase